MQLSAGALAVRAPALRHSSLRAQPVRQQLRKVSPPLAIRRVVCFEEAAPAPPAPKPTASTKKPLKVKQIPLVEAELDEKAKVMIAATAPAVRIGIGEEFGFEVGTNSERKMVSALRALGFDYVFDVDFAADLTILEEGTELLNRLTAWKSGDPDAPPVPMFTSCCPGWIEDLEKKHATIIPNVSTCKSPQGMLGAVVKNYFAQKIGKKPDEVSFVSIMPCVRKLGESERPANQTVTAGHDVDHVLTTVELAELMRNRGVDLAEMEDGEFDKILGASSGAAQLFGTTGGVMEAALRTVYEVVTGAPMEHLNVTAVRGLEGVKEATITMTPVPGGVLSDGDGEQKPIEVKIAVANGLGNAKKLVQDVGDGVSPYHFIEVMACPGGCISGAGQPRSKDKEIAKKRQAGMYDIDERRAIRESHKNPLVKALYEEFLGSPNSHKAHELLHTHYTPQGK